MMTKKDFESIAKAVYKASLYNDQKELVYIADIIEQLQWVLEEGNPRFDRNKFEKACKGGN